MNEWINEAFIAFSIFYYFQLAFIIIFLVFI